MIATVIFEHVDTPFGKAVGIIDFVIKRSSCFLLLTIYSVTDGGNSRTKSCTGHLACAAIHAILQSLVVEMI